MKFYLSSYKVGSPENQEKFKKLAENKKNVAYIPNAMDWATDLERRKASENKDFEDLKQLGFTIYRLDLQEYFGKPKELKKELEKHEIIWVRGGNTFVLRQAMKLSGFDKVLKELIDSKFDMIYGGYSAGVCILGPSLKGLELDDDLTQKPYGEDKDTIWEGLSVLDYVIVPHYQSNHPESEMIEKVVEYYKENNIPFKTLHDGEVIIIE